VPGDAGNDPACTPGAKAPACDADTAPACLGNTASTAVACVGGREIRVNCAALDLGCDVSAIVGAYDVTAACAVRPATCTSDDTCEGTTITSCGRGASYSVDCRSAGLKGGCKVTAGKAACVP